MTAGSGVHSVFSGPQYFNNARHKWILQSLNMNKIPNNVPMNMRNPYMWALEYGSMIHKLPKNLALRLMYYGTPHTIYNRAKTIRNIKNTHPNVTYNDALVLAHVEPYIPRNINPKEFINSYKYLKSKGVSRERAAELLAMDPLLAKKYNASNRFKKAWKTFRYSTMLKSQRTPSNPKWRAKYERNMAAANRSYYKYLKNLKYARPARMLQVMSEIRRRISKIN